MQMARATQLWFLTTFFLAQKRPNTRSLFTAINTILYRLTVDRGRTICNEKKQRSKQTMIAIVSTCASASFTIYIVFQCFSLASIRRARDSKRQTIVVRIRKYVRITQLHVCCRFFSLSFRWTHRLCIRSHRNCADSRTHHTHNGSVARMEKYNGKRVSKRTHIAQASLLHWTAAAAITLVNELRRSGNLDSHSRVSLSSHKRIARMHARHLTNDLPARQMHKLMASAEWVILSVSRDKCRSIHILFNCRLEIGHKKRRTHKF